jgi:sugar phosphate isomerase/epimerase
MKIGLLGLISSDLTDVNYDKMRFASDLGFHGVGAHLNCPADTVSDQTAKNARSAFDDQGLDFIQLWGPYPCIIGEDETVRQEGIRQAQNIIKLASKLGVSESGVRPTSLNPAGAWTPHKDHYKPEVEDRLVDSLKEILKVAEDYDIDLILEAHVGTVLRSSQAIKRVIERTESKRMKLNLDSVNYVGDFATAYDSAPMINEMFDLVGEYTATIHVKDFYLENRLTMHVTETVIGTGMMDLETVLKRSYEWNPNGYLVIEHLPIALIPLAKRNLTELCNQYGIPID